jgi:hypothetical protein
MIADAPAQTAADWLEALSTRLWPTDLTHSLSQSTGASS